MADGAGIDFVLGSGRCAQRSETSHQAGGGMVDDGTRRRAGGVQPQHAPDKALAFLARLASEFTAVLNLPDLVHRVLESLREELGFDSCTVSLLDEHDPDTLTMVGATGIRANFQGLAIPRGQGLNWAVMDAGTPLRIPDMRADPRVFRRDDRILSGIYAPLIAHHRPIGVLSAHRSEVDAFTPGDLDLLTIVARYLAGAFEVARLYDDADRRLRQLQALRDIDMAIGGSLDLRVTLEILLDKVSTQLGVDAANVLLFKPRGQTLDYAAGRGFRTSALQHTHLRLGEGHAGRAAVERRLICVTNLSQEPGDFSRSPLLMAEGFTTYYAVPLIAKGQVKGVLELFHRSPLRATPEWRDFLDALAGEAAIAIDNAVMFDDLQHSNVNLAQEYDTTLEGWSRALALRGVETEGHTQRVTEMTLRLARAIGVSEADLMHIRRGALLHDIGKMGIPDSVLFKPEPLTAEEWEIMRRHTVYAYELLSPIACLRPALDIPYCHHEKWDGTGHPRGLRGEQIPLAARIFAVANAWDVLRSDRPYRPARTEDQAREVIREQVGKHFDPGVVDVFLRMERAAKGLASGNFSK